DPNLLALVSTLGGAAQVWTHDLRTQAWEQLSHEPIGVDQGVWALPDGRFAWWHDGTGDERGRLGGAPAGGLPEPILPGLPVPRDQRLAFTSELGPFERPAIWDVDAGERTDLEVDLPGAVFPIQWWPDASALLVRLEHEGRAQLYRLDPSSMVIDLIADPHGDIESDGGAAIRPDGSVWLLASDATRAPRVIDRDGREVLSSPEEPPPSGRAFRSFFFS